MKVRVLVNCRLASRYNYRYCWPVMTDPNLKIARAIQPYLLRNGFLMTDLPVKDLEKLQQNIRPENRKRGEVLFRQGAYPKGAFWLLSGKIKIFQETETGLRQTLYIYSDGDLTGYRQIISKEPYVMSSILLEDSTIAFISNELFREMLDTSPHFARNVLLALASEFTIWMNRMTTLAQFSVRIRLIINLLTLYEQYRQSGAPPGIITITRTELAECVGTSLETVVRALNTLKSAGLVRVNGRSILLLNPEALADILQARGR